MRPKRLKTDLNLETTKVTNLLKHEKSDEPIISDKSDGVKKTYKNSSIIRIQLKSKRLIKKALKENVNTKLLLNGAKVVEVEGVLDEANKLNKNIQRPRCSYCSKYFKSTVGAKRHEQICVIMSPKNLAKEVSTSKSEEKSTEYSKYSRTVNGKKLEVAKQYSCDLCPKKFSISGALRKHRRTHTGEKPYECMTCHSMFAAKETLNRHVRLHTGEKPHTCQYCGKSFIQSTQLKSHLCNHTGQFVLQPTFVCDLCGKKFDRKTRLNEHIQFVHFGIKPFQCYQCGKTFIRKQDVKRHLIIHSGIKAHQCPKCSKSFKLKPTLTAHLLTHAKEPPRSCVKCGRAFIRQDCLLRHVRNKHKEMLEEIKSGAEKTKLPQ